MVAKKERPSAWPVISLDKSLLSAPALVILAYLVLALAAALSQRTTAFQMVLAFGLALLGSGASTVAALFPGDELDGVERLALSVSLSLAIGGMLGFLLSRTIWGLTFWPFLFTSLLYNAVCFVVTWLRRHKLEGRRMLLDVRRLSAWQKGISISNCIICGVLLVGLGAGVWMLAHGPRLPNAEPPMTEFYLLGKTGLTEAYPETAKPGQTLSVSCGFINRENAAADYQVRALAGGQEVGRSDVISLEADAAHTVQLDFTMPAALGLTKVEFQLVKDGQPWRLLYLWVDVQNP